MLLTTDAKAHMQLRTGIGRGFYTVKNHEGEVWGGAAKPRHPSPV